MTDYITLSDLGPGSLYATNEASEKTVSCNEVRLDAEIHWSNKAEQQVSNDAKTTAGGRKHMSHRSVKCQKRQETTIVA